MTIDDLRYIGKTWLPVVMGLAIVSGYFFLQRAFDGGSQGRILIDGTPLKVGTLSLSPTNGKGKAMSFAVVDGAFQSAESLPEGEYEAVVVVGNRLGMPVPQLKDTPFQELNGARFRLTVQVDSAANPLVQIDLSANDAVPLDKAGGTDVLSSQ